MLGGTIVCLCVAVAVIMVVWAFRPQEEPEPIINEPVKMSLHWKNGNVSQFNYVSNYAIHLKDGYLELWNLGHYSIIYTDDVKEIEIWMEKPCET